MEKDNINNLGESIDNIKQKIEGENTETITPPQNESKEQGEAVLGVTGGDKDKDNSNNSGEIVENYRNPDGTFKAGHPKLGGKELGTNNFATDWDEVVDEIAKENNITKSQARKRLLKVAYKHANEGNFSFYKDIHDRLYGKAKETIKVEGEPIDKIEVEIITRKDEIIKNAGDDSLSEEPPSQDEAGS
jgi:hypothetical protein